MKKQINDLRLKYSQQCTLFFINFRAQFILRYGARHRLLTLNFAARVENSISFIF